VPQGHGLFIQCSPGAQIVADNDRVLNDKRYSVVMEDGIARDLLLPYDRMMEGVRRTAMLYQDPSNRIPYGLFLRATDLRSRSPTALLPLCHAEADSQCKRICAEAALRACLCLPAVLFLCRINA
jgi:hypothetical protein